MLRNQPGDVEFPVRSALRWARAVRVPFEACSDWEDYWASVRIGRAFLSDELAAVIEFDRSLAALRDSDWPAAALLRTTFPFGGAKIQLSSET